MLKLAAMVSSLLVSLGLAAILPAQPPGFDGPASKAKEKGKEAAKKKAEAGPAGDLTKAYDLLRRLRAATAPRVGPKSGFATGPSVPPGIIAMA